MESSDKLLFFPEILPPLAVFSFSRSKLRSGKHAKSVDGGAVVSFLVTPHLDALLSPLTLLACLVRKVALRSHVRAKKGQGLSTRMGEGSRRGGRKSTSCEGGLPPPSSTGCSRKQSYEPPDKRNVRWRNGA